MKKTTFLTFVCWLCSLGAYAQQYEVSGTVTSKQTGEIVEMASVQLLKSDSSFVTGMSSDMKGQFRLQPKKAGNYIVKISFVGYKPSFTPVSLTSKASKRALGKIQLEENSILLSGVGVTVKAAKVEMKADTFMYNANAYRVAKGSTLEALVEQLPGAEVSEDGTIKINGKTVTQILMNGKDFFKGDTKVAMKNLPTEIINGIKAYDKKSDYAKQTGVDDGQEETVLDVGLKRELKSTVFSNVDLGYGSKDRYTGRFFGNYFNERMRISIYGSANNVNDMGFRRGRWGNNGLTAMKSLGGDFMWNNGKKSGEKNFLEINGSAGYSHSSSDDLTWGNSETFLTSGSGNSFGNSWSNSRSSQTNVRARLRLEWNPDTMTTVTLSPSFSHRNSENRSFSRSATFNADPYLVPGVTDPLDLIFSGLLPDSLRRIAVNSNDRQSMSDSYSDNSELSFMVVRKLNSLGRNVSFNTEVGYTKGRGNSFSISDIQYFQDNAEQPYRYTNQYSVTPSKDWNYSARVGYSEPLTKNIHLEARYRFAYNYSDNDRSLYQLGDSLENWGLMRPGLGHLPSTADSLAMARDLRNSQYATYKDYNHTATIGFRVTTDKLNLNASVNFEPQTTEMAYARNRIDTVITRNIFHISPSVRFRYRFTKTSQLDIRYNGNSSEPAMTSLLDVTDDTDPLNVTKGNPGLKPSWTNRLNVFYNNYIVDRQQGWMGSLSFSQTSNSISNAMHYDETTGVRTTRPENINGNWNTYGNFMFNTAFGREKAFNMSTFSDVSYDNSVGFVSTNRDNGSQKNTTKTLTLSENLRASYRTSLFEIGLNGRIVYQNADNKLQKNADLETYRFSYGGNLQFNLPWNMQLTTNLNMESRRGYADRSMNTNELIWNAQIAQSFLRDNSATLSVQFFDILHEASNVSRIINAQMRRDTWSNSINSYFMVHFIYRLNLIGGKKVKEEERHDGPQRGRGSRQGGGMPMMRMGGGRMH